MEENLFSEKEYYRQKIIEMAGKINNIGTLKFILSVIQNYLKSRGD